MNSLVLNLLRLLFDRVTAIAFSLRETFSLPSGPGIGRDSLGHARLRICGEPFGTCTPSNNGWPV